MNIPWLKVTLRLSKKEGKTTAYGRPGMQEPSRNSQWMVLNL